MNSDQLIKAFHATVQASLHGLRALAPALEQERDALSARDPGALEAIVKQKVALLQQLQHSIQARDRLQRAAGHPSGNVGADTLVVEAGNDALSSDWSELLSLAVQVAKINDQNGQLAAQGQHATRAAIGILTGRDQSQPTYSHPKHARRSSGGLSLAHA